MQAGHLMATPQRFPVWCPLCDEQIWLPVLDQRSEGDQLIVTFDTSTMAAHRAEVHDAGD
jgi:hypothetical protein